MDDLSIAAGAAPTAAPVRVRRPVWPVVVEAIALLLILGFGLGLRLWQLGDLPPGLHYDEAIDLDAGLRILGGARPFFIVQGWGREPLYYYLLALVLWAVPDHIVALRLTSVVCGMAGLLLTYGFVRRLAGPIAALFAAGWWAGLFWSVYLSRAGNRGILLPAVLVGAGWLFWSAWERGRAGQGGTTSRFLLAGALLGLCQYTYQPARFAPFIFLLFAAALWLWHRDAWRRTRAGLVAFFAGTALVAAPLAIYLLTTPGLEGDRTWTIAPLLSLLAGDLRPVLRNLVAAAGMFFLHGDPLVSYNVPGRPVFVPAWTAAFFLVGLGLSLWRWRQPRSVLVLSWLGIMLAPTVLTISTPNFPRSVGAIFPTVALAGLGVEAAVALGRAYLGRAGYAAALAVAIFAVAVGGIASADAYFAAWPRARPEAWETVYNVAVGDVVRDLQNAPTKAAAAISSRNIEDAHPVIVATTLQRPDVTIRWVDSTRAVAWPAGAKSPLLYVTADRWLDGDLSTLLGVGAAPARYADRFTVLTLPDANDALDAGFERVQFWLVPPDAPNPLTARTAKGEPLPAMFVGPGPEPAMVRLLALANFPPAPTAGQALVFFSAWEVAAGDIGRPLSLFAHLLDDEGRLVAQEDGLGYPLHTWRPGDRFVQVHRLALPSGTPSALWLRLGLYEGVGGSRWPVALGAGEPTGDSLLFGPILAVGP